MNEAEQNIYARADEIHEDVCGWCGDRECKGCGPEPGDLRLPSSWRDFQWSGRPNETPQQWQARMRQEAGLPPKEAA